MALDPTTNIGKVRLRVGDYSDIPFLPDAVYQSTLDDYSNNLPKSASTCAKYILGMLSQKTHRKLQQLEVFGNQAFEQYKEFLQLTILNPNDLTSLAPLPYSPNLDYENQITAFQYDWNHNYARGRQSDWMALTAFPTRSFAPGDPNAPYFDTEFLIVTEGEEVVSV